MLHMRQVAKGPGSASADVMLEEIGARGGSVKGGRGRPAS